MTFFKIMEEEIKTDVYYRSSSVCDIASPHHLHNTRY